MEMPKNMFGREHTSSDQRKKIDSVTGLIGLSLALFVLLLSPTHTIHLNDSTSKYLAPLEITAMAAEDIFPGAKIPFAAIIFPGVVIKEVSRAFGNCYMSHSSGKQCHWNNIIQFRRLWQEAKVTESSRDQWRQVSGPHYTLMSAACAVITVGGLSGFWVPVQMTLVGFVALLISLYLTPSCSILSNLILMTLLSFMMFLGDGSSVHKPIRQKKQDISVKTKEVGTRPAAAAKSTLGERKRKSKKA